MSQFFSLVFKPILICALLLSSCGAASIMLSPKFGMVSVCPGGQVQLICERLSGSFLYWDVSIPRLDMSRESIVSSQGDISTTALHFNGLHLTEFTVTRTYENPLISQLLITNVTTEINGSTIYCSEDGNENGAPAVAVNVTVYYYGRFLNVSLVNQFLVNKNVTVTLQWSREAGAVYHVYIIPEIPHTEFIANTAIVINLTISYNIQYNVSVVSSLCGVTTTKALKYVTCDQSSQLLNHPITVVSGSQKNPYREGQFIAYTCPPGFVLTGPNASVCTGNGEWEPDPGQVACIADCGVPLSNAKFNYSSTLEGSVLIVTCENDTSTDEQTLSVTCHSNGSWIPNPADFTCSSFITTAPSGFNNKAPLNTLLIITIITILSGVISIILIILTLCAVKRKCAAKKTSVEDHKQQPIYDDIKPYFEEIQVEGNDAYGHVIQCHTSKNCHNNIK